jgi:hypothetical protein
MRSRQLSVIITLMNIKLLPISIHTNETLETIKWNLRGSCYKLKKLSFELVIKSLKGFPEPFDYHRVFGKVIILSVIL